MLAREGPCHFAELLYRPELEPTHLVWRRPAPGARLPCRQQPVRGKTGLFARRFDTHRFALSYSARRARRARGERPARAHDARAATGLPAAPGACGADGAQRAISAGCWLDICAVHSCADSALGGGKQRQRGCELHCGKRQQYTDHLRSGSVAVNCIAANASNTPNTCAAAAWLCAGLWRKLAAHRIPTLHALANAERICCSGHLRRGARATEEEEEEEGGGLAGKLTWRRQSLQCMYFRRLQKLRPPTRRRKTPS